MKTNVNTDPRDYVAEASEFTGKTSMKRFLLGHFSLRRMRFDPSTLSSQPSTAADISPSSFFVETRRHHRDRDEQRQESQRGTGNQRLAPQHQQNPVP
jgi:hypothetical protein